MNGIRKNNHQQSVSIKFPEENLAALISEAKTNFDGIFAALKSELVHYLVMLPIKQEIFYGELD